MEEANYFYKIEDIKDILYLDDLEIDIDKNIVSIEDYDYAKELFEPIVITKIMGFEEDYIEANKYILHVLKKISFEKYKNYKSIISDLIGSFILGVFNDEYKNILVRNINSFKNKDSILEYFDTINQDTFYDFIKSLNNLPKDIRFNFINIIIKSNNIKNLLLQKSSTSKKYELDTNIISIFQDNGTFDINENSYYDALKTFIKDDEYKFKLYDFLNDILEKNKEIAQINCNYANIATTRFLGQVLKFNLILFQELDKTKIFSNCDKSFNETHRKDLIPNERDIYETKVYLQTIKSMKLIHNYISSGYFGIKNMLSSNLFQFSELQTNKLEILDKILNNDNLNKLLNDLVEYYITEFIQIDNEAVDGIIQYYFNIKLIKSNYVFSDNTINYFYKLLGSSTDYCNKHYKFDVFTIICNYFSKLDISYFKDNIKLLEAIIIYHDENDMFKIEELPKAHKYYKLSLEILDKIIDNSTITENSMNQIFLKFFYKINSHTISFIDMMSNLCKEISNYANDYNSSAYRIKFLGVIEIIMHNIYISLKLVNKIIFNKILNPAIFRGEIILPIITLATNVLNYFTDGKIAIYNIFNLNFEALKIMKESLYILHKLTINDEFKELIQETKHIVLEALPSIKFEDNELYIKEELKQNLEYQREFNLENIPEDFLDPLIYTVIKEPVMIPNVDLVFDKASIMSQIYHEKINPYTRELLDENILKTYNDNPKTKEKVREFLQKFSNWKNQNI